MSKGARNIAASVRQKLKNKAAQDKRPFAELLQYYAMERFLYRLTQSAYDLFSFQELSDTNKPAWMCFWK